MAIVDFGVAQQPGQNQNNAINISGHFITDILCDITFESPRILISEPFSFCLINQIDLSGILTVSVSVTLLDFGFLLSSSRKVSPRIKKSPSQVCLNH